jgi:hypothetical protein
LGQRDVDQVLIGMELDVWLYQILIVIISVYVMEINIGMVCRVNLQRKMERLVALEDIIGIQQADIVSINIDK